MQRSPAHWKEQSIENLRGSWDVVFVASLAEFFEVRVFVQTCFFFKDYRLDCNHPTPNLNSVLMGFLSCCFFLLFSVHFFKNFAIVKASRESMKQFRRWGLVNAFLHLRRWNIFEISIFIPILILIRQRPLSIWQCGSSTQKSRLSNFALSAQYRGVAWTRCLLYWQSVQTDRGRQKKQKDLDFLNWFSIL